MNLKIIGDHPLAKNERGDLKSRVGTIFVRSRTLVTLPGIHATQRIAYVNDQNEARAKEGSPALTRDEERAEWANSVDLIMENDLILIRPDSENMALAFEADEILQELVSKQKIKFLQVTNETVRRAIKERGECWRISPLPKSPDEMKAMIRDSKTHIGEKSIYYFNKMTGTRYLTYHEFAQLESLSHKELARQMQEILEFAERHNRQCCPEVDFFMANENFSHRDLIAFDNLCLLRTGKPIPRCLSSMYILFCKSRLLFSRRRTELSPSAFFKKLFDTVGYDQLLAYYRRLKELFAAAVEPEYREDNPDNLTWRNRLFSALVSQRDETISEEILQGLSPEFYMQIEWLPGGRFEDGELMFDPIFDELEKRPDDRELRTLCDERSKGFIFNFIREFGDMEYVNIGRVSGSISNQPKKPGRHEVYIAEIKHRHTDKPVVRMLQMQKWGIREHLDENKDLFWSIIEAEEYTEYNLDRRLGCRQLCMNLPSRINTRKISEKYSGPRREFQGHMIWATYSERNYIVGVGTDKVSASKFANPEYALKFATLLGQAAASNIITGRMNLDKKVLFDKGDEILVEDDQGLPKEIIVADHTGTFADYLTDLKNFAFDYAEPVNRRLKHLSNPNEFAGAYIDAFMGNFVRIQQEYRKRRRAFDTLFKHLRHDERGSFAFRWEKVLARLDWTDPKALGESIRRYLRTS